MATIEIGKDKFVELLGQDGITLIDFWAPWCGPCRVFGPVFEAAAKKHPDLRFGKVNTETEPELAGALQIHSIPTLMVLRDGIPVYRDAGALPPASLEKLIEAVRKLDMNEVRAQLEKEQAEAVTDEAAAHHPGHAAEAADRAPVAEA